MRCFTGIDVPDQIKKRILEVQGLMPRENLTLVREDALHITLHFFDHISENQVRKVIEALDSESPGKFDVDIRGISYFGGKEIHTIFVKVNDPEGRITSLYHNIGESLASGGVRYDSKAYTPHITIARCKRDGYRLAGFMDGNSDTEFGSFSVERIFLKQSVLSNQGPVYTTLHEHEI